MPANRSAIPTVTRDLNGRSNKTNYAAGMSEFLKLYEQFLPGVAKIENNMRPGFMGANLTDASNFLFGVGGAGGLTDLQSQLFGGQASLIDKARGADIRNMSGDANAVRGLFDRLSPEAAGAIDGMQSGVSGAQQALKGYNTAWGSANQKYSPLTGNLKNTMNGLNVYVDPTITNNYKPAAETAMATSMAKDALNRSRGLNMEERRAADQSARQSAAARGRLMDQSASAAEILNRDATMRANRAEAATLGQQAFGQRASAEEMQRANEMALFGQRESNVNRKFAKAQESFDQAATNRQLGNAARAQGFNQFLQDQTARQGLRDSLAQRRGELLAGAAGFYSAPGLNLLNQNPQSLGATNNMLGLGLGGIGSAKPMLLNPDAGINMENSRFQNIINQRAAKRNSSSSLLSGGLNALGSLFGAMPTVSLGGGLVGGLLGKIF